MAMEDEQGMLPGLWHWPPRWEEESQQSVHDLTLVPILALMFFVVRYLLDRVIFERMGRKSIAGISDDLSEMGREENEKRLIKYKESAWKCVYYATAEVLALAVTYNEPWFTDTKWFYVGPGEQIWPNLNAKQLCRAAARQGGLLVDVEAFGKFIDFPQEGKRFTMCKVSQLYITIGFIEYFSFHWLKLKMLYTFSGGFYTYSIFALCFWETRRKDFGVSMTHHVGTVALIIISYITNLQRPGSVILALHDASDVFLEIGKLTKYSGLHLVPEIAFGVFALSWVLLRLIYFPFVIIESTTYGVLQVLDKKKHPNGPYLYYTLNTLLICLLVLHLYWWVLIWRMIKKQVQNSGKISEDVRSDSDDDSDDDSDLDDVKDKTE